MGGITLTKDGGAAPGGTAPPTAGSTPRRPAPAPRRNRTGPVLTGLVLAVLLAAFQQLAVAAVLPALAADLPGGPGRVPWAVVAYLLTAGASLPLHGKLGDLYGRKGPLLCALALFAAASALAGWARTPDELVALRAVQGLGAGGVLAGAQAVTASLAPAHRRARHLALLGAAFAVATAAGPLLGAYVAGTASWRWTFHLTAPGCLAALLLVGAALAPPEPGAARGRGSAAAHRRARSGLPGALLLGAAATCLFLLLAWAGGQYAWTSRTVALLACAAAAGLLLCAATARRVPEPVLPPRLPRDPAFLIAGFAAAAVGACLAGLAVCLPALLRRGGPQGLWETVLPVLPFVGSLAAASLVSGHLAHRTGRYAVQGAVGVSVAWVGVWLLSRADADTPYVEHGVWQALAGTGLGLVLPVLVLAAQNAAPPADLGAATGVHALCGQLGVCAGVTLLGTLAAGPRALPSALREGYVQAYADAAPRVLLHLAAFLGAGLLAVLFLRERTPADGTGPAGGTVPGARTPEPGPGPAAPGPLGSVPSPANGTAYESAGGAYEPDGAAYERAGEACEPATGPGAPLCGTVRHHDGAPVPGAALTLLDARGRQAGRGASGPGGRYALSTPAPGAYVLIASATGHRPRAVTLTAGARPDGPVERDVVLGGAGRLRGTVAAPDGTPVEDALVTLTDARGEVVATARTGPGGGYALTGLLAGDHTLTAGAPGLGPTALPVRVRADGETWQDVEVAGGGVVCGTVRAPDGRPVEDARVSLLDAAGDTVGTLLTGPDGAFHFPDLASGAYTVIASGYPPVATALQVAGGARTTEDVRLAHGG
ncbi:MFS transporter [Streptomyces sudanensis]|uniref:MFS transporter n=1 Tax=Streptomyces sudanensis TaxID=436397 RepID=UPI0020CB729B|nr:MFS transporter [Streptomyces sudanensis]MCP9956578.1 MFS transporter [Streptomyces sudanensis]MCQ0002821.1 MFS transporter [Streptomyces sudanensis]